METRMYNVYEFSELTDKQKEKVIANYHDFNVQGEWYGFVLEEWTEKLEEMGFKNPDIRFTGFWSQGDGASFTCDKIDVEKLLSQIDNKRLLFIQNLPITFSIIRDGSRYVHEHSCKVHWDGEAILSQKEDELFSEFISVVSNIRLSLSKEIYKILEEEYEYLTSPEALKEFFDENNYMFTEDGKIVT